MPPIAAFRWLRESAVHLGHSLDIMLLQSEETYLDSDKKTEKSANSFLVSLAEGALIKNVEVLRHSPSR